MNVGSQVRLSKYSIPLIDPTADAYRIQSRCRDIKKDICSKTMKWALHLSQYEYEGLERLNPDTLGHDDPKIRQYYWKDFIEGPESNVFKIQKV